MGQCSEFARQGRRDQNQDRFLSNSAQCSLQPCMGISTLLQVCSTCTDPVPTNTRAGEKPEKAALLSSVQLAVARSGGKVPVGAGGEELELLVLPTPR